MELILGLKTEFILGLKMKLIFGLKKKWTQVHDFSYMKVTIKLKSRRHSAPNKDVSWISLLHVS